MIIQIIIIIDCANRLDQIMQKLSTFTPEQQLVLARHLLKLDSHPVVKKDFIKTFFRDATFVQMRTNLIDDHLATTLNDGRYIPMHYYDSNIIQTEPIWTPQLVYSVDRTQPIGKYGIVPNGIYSYKTLYDVLDETERISVMVAVIDRRKTVRTKPHRNLAKKRYNPYFSHTLEGLQHRYDLAANELNNLLFPKTLASIVSQHILQVIASGDAHTISFEIMPDDSTIMLFKRGAELQVDQHLCRRMKKCGDRLPKDELAKFWMDLGISIQSALWSYFEPIPASDPAAAQGKTRRYPLRTWIRTFYFQIPPKRLPTMNTFENLMDYAAECMEYKQISHSQREMRRLLIKMSKENPSYTLHDIIMRGYNISPEDITPRAAASASASTPTVALAKALSAPRKRK